MGRARGAQWAQGEGEGRMICEPVNDHSCLLPTSQYAVAQLARADLRELADRFNSTRNLAAWIRSLPQLNDTGPRDDGAPRIACDVAQRARLPTATPNCFERALLFLVLAEFIDPRPVRQLKTMNTPVGRHTVAVEEGRVINLNPSELVHDDAPSHGPRNAAAPDEHHDERPAPRRPTHNGHPRVPTGTPPESVRMLAWVLSIADCHADVIDPANGHECMRRVHGFFARRGLMPPAASDAPPAIVARADFDFSLAAAQLGAQHYGDDGKTAVAVYRSALDRLGLLTPTRPTPQPWDTRNAIGPPWTWPYHPDRESLCNTRSAPSWCGDLDAARAEWAARNAPDDSDGDDDHQADDNAGDDLSFGEGMATLHAFRDSDPWDQSRNAVELSHLADPDWRNCGCGMPRNAVELAQLRDAFDWKGFGQDVLGVTHQIGGGILRTYGLGGVADATGNLYEQQGWVKPKQQPQQQRPQQQPPAQPPPAQQQPAPQPPPARPVVVAPPPPAQPRPVERRSDDDGGDADDDAGDRPLVGSLHAL